MTRDEENTILAQGYELWKRAVLSRVSEQKSAAFRKLGELFLTTFPKVQ